MPAPLVLAGVAAFSTMFGAAASDVGRVTAKRWLKRQVERHRDEIERWALETVFEQLGLPDLLSEGGLNRKAFTEAINSNFLGSSEFKLSDVFSAEAVKQDAVKFAIMQAATEAGFQIENPTVNGMKDAIRRWLMDQIEMELTAEDVGELIQDAKDIYEIVALYRRYKKAEAEGEAAESEGGRRPLINTPEAAKNRERQARYRAAHRKKWVPR